VFAVPPVVAIVFGAFGAVLYLMHAFRRRTPQAFAALSLCIVFCALGIFRTHLALRDTAHPLDGSVGHATLSGFVGDEPSFSERSQTFTLTVRDAQEYGGERVRISAPVYPVFAYGDEISVSGTLQKPQSFETETGATFDYPAYLAKDGIFFQMTYPDITRLSRGGGNAFFRVLYAARRAFVRAIGSHLPQRDAALLSGIAIGAKDGMDDATQDMFRRVGLTHIVVLSGYNITVVSDVVVRIGALVVPLQKMV
jgi:competence protein ComEC